jgi:hypothetical protein
MFLGCADATGKTFFACAALCGVENAHLAWKNSAKSL